MRAFPKRFYHSCARHLMSILLEFNILMGGTYPDHRAMVMGPYAQEVYRIKCRDGTGKGKHE